LGDGKKSESRRLAYQLAFELEDNASQQLLKQVQAALPPAPVVAPDAAADQSKPPLQVLHDVLGGRVSVDLYLAFLYRCCKADSQILREAKAAVEYVVLLLVVWRERKKCFLSTT
jgi:hypothetical protein